VNNGTVYASGNIGMTRDMKVVEGGVQAQTVRDRHPLSVQFTLLLMELPYVFSVPLSRTWRLSSRRLDPA